MHRYPMPRFVWFTALSALLALCGCAAVTTAELTPAPQAPVCAGARQALILWAPQWRPDQKDVAAREAAAADGLGAFFDKSGCFETATVRRVSSHRAQAIQEALAQAAARNAKLVLVTVRELGPTVRLGSSLALVEGGTEVVLDITEYDLPQPAPRVFTVHWRNGGPGVVKGVATLAQDLQAALAAGLQPRAR
jgi:hypothetical protein